MIDIINHERNQYSIHNMHTSTSRGSLSDSNNVVTGFIKKKVTLQTSNVI